MKKICSKCRKEKELFEFHKEIKGKFGVKAKCAACTTESSKIWKTQNREREQDNRRRWNQNNKERHSTATYKWRKENAKKHATYVAEYQANRKKIDPKFKLLSNVRSLLYNHLMRKNLKKHNSTFTMIGCSPQELKEYLEKQFKPEMNWENYGRNGWHIDHIIPLSLAETEQEMLILCHYTNLQPLWAIDNIKKSNKTIV